MGLTELGIGMTLSAIAYYYTHKLQRMYEVAHVYRQRWMQVVNSAKKRRSLRRNEDGRSW